MTRKPLASTRRYALVVAALTLALPRLQPLAAQQSAATPATVAATPERLQPLPIADYARWRSIQGATIAATGEWVAWSYAQVRRDDVLHVRHVDSGREHIVERASRATLSDDGRWVALSSKPPYGVSGYTKDGRGVILDHRYDLWLVPFDGSTPRNLTNGIGSEHAIRFRYVRLDPEERFIDLSQPVLFSAYGQWTKYGANCGEWRYTGAGCRCRFCEHFS